MSGDIIKEIGHAIASTDDDGNPVFLCPSGWQAAMEEIFISTKADTDYVADIRANPTCEADKKAQICSIAAFSMPVEKYNNSVNQLLNYVTWNTNAWDNLRTFLCQGRDPRDHILYHASILAGKWDWTFWAYVKEHATPEHVAEIKAEIFGITCKDSELI